jgi:capsular polysaccharide transport system permease protein
MAQVKKRSTLKVWGDVIFALFLREVKSQANDKIGIAWAVISPLILIGTMTAMRTFMSSGGATHGMPTFIFMVVGLILIQFFLGVFEKTSSAIQKNKPLYAFRQVQPISSIIAIAGFELLVKIFVILIIALVCFFIRLDVQINDWLEVILVFFKVWLMGVAFGTLFGLASMFIPEIKKLQQLITRPLFFLSGIFFSLQDIPREYWHYLIWNPLLHAVELTRFAAYPAYGDAGVSDWFLDMIVLISCFFALAVYHVAWKPAISR